MTTELEQEFYDTFGIEPECHNPIVKLSKDKKCEGICKNCEQYNYPNITAEKLLEMICINSQKGGIEIFNRKNIEELKNLMLQYCIDRLGYALNKEQYKHQIQKLFKEEE